MMNTKTTNSSPKSFLLFCLFVLLSSQSLFAQKPDTSAPKNKALEEVVVTARKADFKLQGDKKVFDVASSISGQGGTALSVLRNIPSLDVDMNGNVILRGTSPKIFVDGKPSDLTLEQIPASDIDQIEIITMPSAKYEASSSGGILNIVMKNKIKQGVQGMLMAGIDRLAGWNFGGNITYGLPKWDLSLNVFLRNDKSTATQDDYRKITQSNGTLMHIASDGENKGDRYFYMFSPAVKYKFDASTNLQASARFFIGKFGFDNVSNVNVDSLRTSDPAPIASKNKTTSINDGDVFFSSYNLSFDRKMKQKGSMWSAQIRYQQARASRPTSFATQYINPASKDSVIRNTNDGTNKSVVASTDFTLQLRPTIKLEFGGQFSWRYIDFDLKTYRNDLIDTANTSAYNNTEVVGGVYGTFSHELGKFSYQLGLRLESSFFNANIKSKNLNYNIDYPFLPFPSAFVQYKFNNTNTLQFSYAYKVDRPSFFQTLPIKQYGNALNISEGNPNLRPAFIHLLELNHNLSFPKLKNSNILFTLYYKNTQNLITTYFKEVKNTEGKTEVINTPDNSGTLNNIGLEITPRLVLANWYNVTPNINVLYANIAYSRDGATSSIDGWSAFFKLNQNFELPKNWRIQWTAKYNTRSMVPPNSSSNQGNNFRPQQNLTAQGYLIDVFEMGIGFEKNWKNKFFLSFNINDILGTSYKGQVVNVIDNLYQSNKSLENPYMAQLNLRYVFNTMKTKTPPDMMRQQPKRQQGGGDEAMF